MISGGKAKLDRFELWDLCVTETVFDVEGNALFSSQAGNVGGSSTIRVLGAFTSETAGGLSTGGSTRLPTLVATNMDTLPGVRGALLQQVLHVTQRVRADVPAHIQSRLDVTRKTSEHLLSVIEDIPGEAVAVFRSNIASLVQAVMAEVQAVSEERNGQNASITTSTNVAAIPNTIRIRLDRCLDAALVAMSEHVELVVNGLRSTYVSSWSLTDVAVEVSLDVQHILSAKVAIAMQECFEEACQTTRGTSYPLDCTQTIPRAEVLQADLHELVDASEDVREKVVQKERVREEVAESAWLAEEFVDAPNDRALDSLSSTRPHLFELHADSPISSPGQINPDARELHEVSHIASDTVTDASDGLLYLPGSAGHPELCSRPCVFAAVGQCELGFSCRFCHLAHAKAPHLDKKRRDALKRMTYEERVAAILPLVRLKLVELQLDPDLLQDVSAILSTLQPSIYTSDVGQSMRQMQRTRLTKFTLRFLFGVLDSNGSGVAPTALRASVDRLFSKIKREVSRTL